eukprot:Gb_35518 [translate_table: standard]
MASGSNACPNSPATPVNTTMTSRFLSNLKSASGGFDRSSILQQVGDIHADLRLTLSPAQLAYCADALNQLKKKLHSSSGQKKINKDFDTLELERVKKSDLLSRSRASQRDVNLCKNRYMDILPYDETRVVLNVEGRSLGSGSDFINANYIMNTSKLNLHNFIATQGPLPTTSEDFWEMILQHRSPVIVMLTQVTDKNHQIMKCADYFPLQERESRNYKRIRVFNKSLQISRNSIAIRVLEVMYKESDEPPLSVLHLQYTDWPDHGVPSFTLPVRELVKRLYCIPPNLGPCVIHCSAGIGRTGAFCTIDHTVHRILAGDLSALDFGETVRQFRRQRFGMVQTREQYFFCHSAVVDELEDLIYQQAKH